MNARSFRIGGVHPEENKLTHEVATQVAPLPKQAIFPLSQHIGAPAKPVVKKGDKVKVGTLLAEAGGFVFYPIVGVVAVGRGALGDDDRELQSLGSVDGHQPHGIGGTRQRKSWNGFAIPVHVVPPDKEVGGGGDLRLRIFMHAVEKIGDEGVSLHGESVKLQNFLHCNGKRAFVPGIQCGLKILDIKMFFQNLEKTAFLQIAP